MSSIRKKTIIDIHITTYISSYFNIYPVINKALSRVPTIRQFILHKSFVFLCFLINISEMYQISIIWKNILASCLKQYVTTCFQIRSRIILLYFWLRTWLIYFLLLVCGNCSLTLKTGRCMNLL